MIEPIDNSPPVAGIDMILVDEYALRPRPYRQAHPTKDRRRDPIALLLGTAFVILAVVALVSGPADPTPAAAAPLASIATDPTPAPAVPVVVPAPTSGELGAMLTGVAAYAAPSFGPSYLAIPDGPGHRVQVCSQDHPDRCYTRTSTDAGPDLKMQRAGRIADLSFVDFMILCRCNPPTVGTMHVTIEYLGGGSVTAPPTDVEP